MWMAAETQTGRPTNMAKFTPLRLLPSQTVTASDVNRVQSLVAAALADVPPQIAQTTGAVVGTGLTATLGTNAPAITSTTPTRWLTLTIAGKRYAMPLWPLT